MQIDISPKHTIELRFNSSAHNLSYEKLEG